MAAKSFYRYKHITASAVVLGSGVAGSQGTDNTGKQGILHTVTINSAAAGATIQIFDYNSTTSPPAGQAITGLITAPAGGITNPLFLQFDCEVDVGVTVIIAVAAADITVVAA